MVRKFEFRTGRVWPAGLALTLALVGCAGTNRTFKTGEGAASERAFPRLFASRGPAVDAPGAEPADPTASAEGPTGPGPSAASKPPETALVSQAAGGLARRGADVPRPSPVQERVGRFFPRFNRRTSAGLAQGKAAGATPTKAGAADVWAETTREKALAQLERDRAEAGLGHPGDPRTGTPGTLARRTSDRNGRGAGPEDDVLPVALEISTHGEPDRAAVARPRTADRARPAPPAGVARRTWTPYPGSTPRAPAPDSGKSSEPDPRPPKPGAGPIRDAETAPASAEVAGPAVPEPAAEVEAEVETKAEVPADAQPETGSPPEPALPEADSRARREPEASGPAPAIEVVAETSAGFDSVLEKPEAVTPTGPPADLPTSPPPTPPADVPADPSLESVVRLPEGPEASPADDSPVVLPQAIDAESERRFYPEESAGGSLHLAGNAADPELRPAPEPARVATEAAEDTVPGPVPAAEPPPQPSTGPASSPAHAPAPAPPRETQAPPAPSEAPPPPQAEKPEAAAPEPKPAPAPAPPPAAAAPEPKPAAPPSPERPATAPKPESPTPRLAVPAGATAPTSSSPSASTATPPAEPAPKAPTQAGPSPTKGPATATTPALPSKSIPLAAGPPAGPVQEGRRVRVWSPYRAFRNEPASRLASGGPPRRHGESSTAGWPLRPEAPATVAASNQTAPTQAGRATAPGWGPVGRPNAPAASPAALLARRGEVVAPYSMDLFPATYRGAVSNVLPGQTRLATPEELGPAPGGARPQPRPTILARFLNRFRKDDGQPVPTPADAVAGRLDGRGLWIKPRTPEAAPTPKPAEPVTDPAPSIASKPADVPQGGEGVERVSAHGVDEPPQR